MAERFSEERERLNQIVLKHANRDIKRFYALDSEVYRAGALSEGTKELLGLVASLVLRCDDCIAFHVIECKKAGVKEEELMEALSIALVVGGSITIPHLRRALELWDNL
jgi:AhpD family alkylhydroperoxidase